MFAGTRMRAVVACISICISALIALSLCAADVAAQGTPTITVTRTSVAPDGTMTATVSNAAENARGPFVRYFGVNLIDWKYLNGSNALAATGSVTVTAAT